MCHFIWYALVRSNAVFCVDQVSKAMSVTAQGANQDSHGHLSLPSIRQGESQMSRTVNFTGRSGKTYQYWIYPVWPSLKNEPGNYALAIDNGSTIKPVYFGQTNSLANRVNENHERWLCAKRNGANCVCAHTSGDEDTRCAEETDLVANYDPACNR